MIALDSLAQAVSMVFFAAYGLSCFFSKRMIDEFERYRVGSIRTLTGALQIAAAVGLALGYTQPVFLVMSSGGLFIMMAVAIVVRIRIRDSFLATLPAVFFFALNGILLFHGILKMRSET